MSSSLKDTTKYTLQRPINKEMYEQAEAQGLQIYDTAGRRAVGVDSATGKVKYEYENQPSNSSVTIPGSETSGNNIGSGVGKITYDNLTGTGANTGTKQWKAPKIPSSQKITADNVGTKTSVFKPQLPQKSPEKLPGTVDTPKITKFPLKVNDGVYKPETPWRTMPKVTEREGSRIRNRVEKAITNKWNDPSNSHLFDDIDDDTIEKNIPLAKELVEKNKKTGYLGSDPDKTYPYMLDGMTMYLASGDKNKPKAAKKSHDVAYWEDKSKKAEASSWENISADLQKYSNTYDNTSSEKTVDSQAKKNGIITFPNLHEEILKQILSKEDRFAKLKEANSNSEQITEEITKEPVYYSQLDERWANVKYNGDSGIGDTGCGVTSMAMILSALTDKTVTPPEMAQYSKDIDTAVGGTDIPFFKKAAEKYGLKATDSYWAYEYYADKVKDDLNSGSMYIVDVKPGSVWNHGHIIVVSEYVESNDGNYFIAYDPNFDKGKTYYKNGVTIDEATEGKIYIPEDVFEKDAYYMIGISK